MPIEETQLKQLVLDEDFTSLQSLASEQISLMSIIRVAHKELQHSNFLAWLFDPHESHKQGDFFIKELLKLYFKENKYEDLGGKENPNNKISVFDYIDLDLSDVIIKREHKQIDILVISESNQLCILIENKIYAKEGGDQLTRYREDLEKEYPNHRRVHLYLSLFEQNIRESESNHYIPITYIYIKRILEYALNFKKEEISANTKVILSQYLQTLNSLMDENKELQEKAEKLYRKYRAAFDLVFKYGSSKVPNNLKELIDQESKNGTIVPFHGNNTYIRFQPQFLYDNIDALKAKGFILEDDDLSDSWIFLFEFHVTQDIINFDLKIGDYSDDSCRQKLHELYLKHPDFFNKVKRANNKLSAAWHLSYQKHIVTRNEYNKLIDSGDDTLDKKIQSRFREIIDKVLPEYQSIIEGALK